MTNYDPRDPYPSRQPKGNPPTRAYSQANESYPYTESQYTQDQYTQNQYTQGQYAQSQYSGYGDEHYDQQAYTRQTPQPTKRPRRGPDIDPLMFSGGVLMTGVVTGLAAWLVAWILRTIADKVNQTGGFDRLYSPLQTDELWFALLGFFVALVAGAAWYLLQIATPAPDQFYRWIVMLLIAAAVIIPISVTTANNWDVGVGTAILHLVIGLPVLFLIPTMAHASRRKS